MEEDKKVDQIALAEDLSSKISYEFFDMFLVKPLDPVKVKKEFSKPVTDNKAVADKNGVEAVDFDEVETEVKEVDSDYRRGIVLKLPTSYQKQVADSDNFPYINTNIKVGSVVVFRDVTGQRFDLLKDSRLLKIYEIIGIDND